MILDSSAGLRDHEDFYIRRLLRHNDDNDYNDYDNDRHDGGDDDDDYAHGHGPVPLRLHQQIRC